MSGVKPAMTQDKAPVWAEKEAGTLALDYVDWLGRDKVDRDAEHVLTSIVALALSQAYERGQESMRERAALHARAAFDDRPRRDAMDWNDGFDDGTKAAAQAIRSLPIEQEGGE